MRSVLTALLRLLLPARGRHRAAWAAVPATRPTRPPLLPANHQPRPRHAVIEADTLPVVPRYLVEFEREQERKAQRHRRTALVLAEAGIDFLGVSA